MATIGDLDDIRSGLATNAATISGLRTKDHWPDTVHPPMAVVGTVTVEYDQSMQRGADLYTAQLVVLVADGEPRVATDELSAYMAKSGATSVKAAIESDKTLGGAAKTLRVARMEGFKTYELAPGQRLLGAEWSVQIWA